MKKPQARFRPTLEPLEDRFVPTGLTGKAQQALALLQASFSASFSATQASGSITATLAAGVLTVQGSAHADRIVLRNSQDMIQVQGTGKAFRAADVLSIVIHGRGGNDVIDLRAFSLDATAGASAALGAGLAALGAGLPTPPACTIFGDAGNDTIFGGTCSEIIHGGAGDDILRGNAGNDQLFGAAGNDRLEGHQGDDRLDGGIGRDILLGGLGADLLCSVFDRVADRLDGGAGDDTVLCGMIAGVLSRDLADVLRSIEIKFPASTDPPPTPLPAKAASIDTIRADLAARLGVPLDTIHVVRVEEGYWPDTALGCPEPGMAYAQVLVRGRRVVLEANSQTYEYHTDDAFTGSFILCPEPMGTLYPLYA